jgi:hypothetical protein
LEIGNRPPQICAANTSRSRYTRRQHRQAYRHSGAKVQIFKLAAMDILQSSESDDDGIENSRSGQLSKNTGTRPGKLEATDAQQWDPEVARSDGPVDYGTQRSRVRQRESVQKWRNVAPYLAGDGLSRSPSVSSMLTTGRSKDAGKTRRDDSASAEMEPVRFTQTQELAELRKELQHAHNTSRRTEIKLRALQKQVRHLIKATCGLLCRLICTRRLWTLLRRGLLRQDYRSASRWESMPSDVWRKPRLRCVSRGIQRQ